MDFSVTFKPIRFFLFCRSRMSRFLALEYMAPNSRFGIFSQDPTGFCQKTREDKTQKITREEFKTVALMQVLETPRREMSGRRFGVSWILNKGQDWGCIKQERGRWRKKSSLNIKRCSVKSNASP